MYSYLRNTTLGNEHVGVAQSLNDLADVLEDQNRLIEAEPLQRQALEMSKKLRGEIHEDTANLMNNLALMLLRENKLDEAEALYCETLEIRRKVYGEDHPVVAQSLKNLALVLRRERKWPEAEPVLRQAVELSRKQSDHETRETSDLLADLAVVLIKSYKFTEAELAARECFTIRSELTPDSSGTFVAQSMVGTSLLGQNRFTEAEPLLVQACEGLTRLQGQKPSSYGKWLVNEAGERIVQLYESWGKPTEAAEWRKKLSDLAKAPAGTSP
ncbi:MAG TPA: tetratricopeptide repeat-containing protein [Verrucomicrobiae bacterium]|nr:tetratricopeptide repeat-containing protein [Verrucomicrobiae bacterium]